MGQTPTSLRLRSLDAIPLFPIDPMEPSSLRRQQVFLKSMQGNDSEPETGKQMVESKEMRDRRGAHIKLKPPPHPLLPPPRVY